VAFYSRDFVEREMFVTAGPKEFSCETFRVDLQFFRAFGEFLTNAHPTHSRGEDCAQNRKSDSGSVAQIESSANNQRQQKLQQHAHSESHSVSASHGELGPMFIVLLELHVAYLGTGINCKRE
jgi:hypothetical protein